MPVTIDKADVFRRMARVRAWTRNGDIVELCDTLEHVLKTWEPCANLSRDTAQARTVTGDMSRDNDGSADTVQTSGKATCPECAKRRAADLARQQRKRQRAKAKTTSKPATQAA
jgi:hypothetical protein